MNTRGVYGLLFLLTIVLAAAVVISPVNAQSVGLAASPSTLNYNTLAQNQQATQSLTVYNSGNTSQLNFTAAVQGVQGSVSPSSGVIPAKGNMTLAVTVTGSGTGLQTGRVLLNSTAGSSASQVTVLPALAVGIDYTASGANYATSIYAASPIGMGLVVLAVLALIAASLVAYLIVLKRRGAL